LKTITLKTLTIGSLFLSPIAYAGDCVEIDSDRDNLTADQQRSAQLLFSNSLESEGVTVGEPCDNVWKLSHVRMGDSVTVRAEGPERIETMTTSVIEDLPRIYSQLASAMVNGTELAGAASRDNVTVEQSRNQRRVRADYLATMRFGGALLSPSSGVLPMFAGGMRLELDRYAIDADWTIVVDTNDDAENFGMGGHLNVISFTDPLAMHTPYFGAGMGYGGVTSDVGGNAGFEGQLFGGYEMFRASTMRLFFQGNAILPAYTLDDGSWFPTMSVSMGIGYKPQPKNNSSVPWWALFL
jgi:hypothetical protein